jgi:tripeptide aminopeptidase
MSFVLSVLLGLSLQTSAGVPQPSADDAVKAVVGSAKFKEAAAAMDRDHDRMVSEIVMLTEIPAPPFKETARGQKYLELLKAHGLTDVEMDPEGNVMGLRKGTAASAPLIAIAAHLDTVFPEGTDVKVKRDATRLYAPGIGDDTRSLAVLLALIRAMDAAKIQTKSDILFIGNVGEEGPGDLRGVKYLFQKGKYKDRIKQFISVDGSSPGTEITNGATGSKRYRATFKGPGGHSYGAFGIVSPAFAMGNAMKKFGALAVPNTPKTTFSVGVVGGGTSVNSIPFETWMEVDMRSESPAELTKLDAAFKRVLDEAVVEENAARSTASGKISLDLKLIGDRPSGETPKDSPIVQIAAASIRAVGLTPTFQFSSTDSNLPISMGIPAITLDSGGKSGNAHALTEWIDVEKTASLGGMRIALATLLALAGMN